MTFARLLQRIPGWGEFLIMVGVCWGWFAFRSASMAVGMAAHPAFDDAYLLGLIGHELVAGAVAFLLLRARGWSHRDFPIQITWTGSGAGLLLLLLDFLLNWAAVDIGRGLGGTVEPLTELSQSISTTFPVAVLASIVNGGFEELFLVGYVFRALERHDLPLVLGVSAFLRMVAHVYQGPAGALSLLCMGVFFGLVYARYRQLWPLMLAHIGADVLVLAR